MFSQQKQIESTWMVSDTWGVIYGDSGPHLKLLPSITSAPRPRLPVGRTEGIGSMWKPQVHGPVSCSAPAGLCSLLSQGRAGAAIAGEGWLRLPCHPAAVWLSQTAEWGRSSQLTQHLSSYLLVQSPPFLFCSFAYPHQSCTFLWEGDLWHFLFSLASSIFKYCNGIHILIVREYQWMNEWMKDSAVIILIAFCSRQHQMLFCSSFTHKEVFCCCLCAGRWIVSIAVEICMKHGRRDGWLWREENFPVCAFGLKAHCKCNF